ncbi:MAG: hybrid sensor histidine kinase/response regulator, partial [Polyangiaceae bacterium]
EGYRVVLANGGAEAIAAFETEQPDCILLDVRMPDVDGFTACERIRALPNGAATPILFLTAQRDVDTFDRALRAGGDDFLTKPVRPTELVVRVQTALKLRRLSLELGEHYELVKHHRDDLLRVQLQKERLTAFVVHDLKNPVNSMDLQAQLLLRESGISESVREAATLIRTEARQLNRMIMNLLDLSKGDEGRLAAKRTAVDLRALVAEIFAELDVSARMRKVTLESAIDVAQARIDEDLTRRMLTNLVENGIRHAPPGSVVTLTATASDEGLELRISDKGNGVPRELREKIFDPFVQVEGSEHGTTSRGGRGLGLTFCRLAAAAHDGRIWVEDGSPGSVFCVRISHDG